MSLLSLFPFPSLFVAFFHCFSEKSHSLSLLSLHLMYYWRRQQAEWKREKEREGGCRKILWHGEHEGLGPLNRAMGEMYNVQRMCTGRLNKSLWSVLPQMHDSLFILPFWESYICKLILTCPTNTLLLSKLLSLLLTNTLDDDYEHFCCMRAMVCICDPKLCSQ